MEEENEQQAERPSTEVGDVNPSSITHLIGQAGVKNQVTTAIEASFADHRRFDHALLVGPPGLGKSAMANVIAREMACDFTEVLAKA